MPKVKLNTILAGPQYSGRPGQVITVDDKTAAALIEGKYAVDAETPAEGSESEAGAPAAPKAPKAPKQPKAPKAPKAGDNKPAAAEGTLPGVE